MKNRVLAAVDAAGLTAWVAGSRWRQERLLVLCYHGVSQDDEHLWDGALYIPQEQLARRLAFLRANKYAILPLGDALQRLAQGTLPPRSVSITFDDGAVDFATRAVPVLEQYDAPATLYLTTYYVSHQLPVFDTMLSYVLWKGGADTSVLGEVALPTIPSGPLSREARLAAVSAVKGWAADRGLSGDDKHQLLREIARRARVDVDALVSRRLLMLMAPEEVARLPRPLIDVQLHTHRHRTPRVKELFLNELADNTAHLRALGVDGVLDGFCYPSGDYAIEYVSWLPEAGVKHATTCVPGLVSRTSHPLLLPRFIDTCTTSDVVFEAWAAGVAAWLPRRAEYRMKFDPARA